MLSKQTEQVPEQGDGERLDRVAAQLWPEFSRARLQQWIDGGQLTVNGGTKRRRDKVFLGDVLELDAQVEEEGDWQPEAIPLDIVWEDEHLLVVNKPAGLVVHPGAGNPDGTLLNAVLHHCPGNASVPRAGIVHRLDRDTTGLMVVAKTLQAQTELVRQLQARSVHREYAAIVWGQPNDAGRIEANIGRHPTQRTRMAVLRQGGKPAITRYELIEGFTHHSWIRCNLETGRTHQIRVHMTHLGFPLVGDPAYRKGGLPRLTEALEEQVQGFGRQALHAYKLTLVHPASAESISWQADMPEDMAQLVSALRQDAEVRSDDS